MVLFIMPYKVVMSVDETRQYHSQMKAPEQYLFVVLFFFFAAQGISVTFESVDETA